MDLKEQVLKLINHTEEVKEWDQTVLNFVVEAISTLEDAEWAKAPIELQNWFNESVECYNEGKELPPIEKFEKKESTKAPKKEKAPKAEKAPKKEKDTELAETHRKIQEKFRELLVQKYPNVEWLDLWNELVKEFTYDVVKNSPWMPISRNTFKAYMTILQTATQSHRLK